MDGRAGTKTFGGVGGLSRCGASGQVYRGGTKVYNYLEIGAYQTRIGCSFRR